MPPLRSLCASLVSFCPLVAACSTPISPYSPLDDEDEAQEELPVIDAGTDAGRARDAGPQDAGLRDAAANAPNCTRISSADYYASLLDDDCASRSARACSIPGQSSQMTINQLVMNLATRCGVAANVALGVGFSRAGCPLYFGANGADLRGRVSQCLQNELETWRFPCSLSCAVTGAFLR